MITSDVRDLICPERPEWARLMPVRLLGRHVEAIVTHVADEHARRRACGLGALEDSALLRVLFDLPVGVPVPSSRLSRWDQFRPQTQSCGCRGDEPRHGNAARLPCREG